MGRAERKAGIEALEAERNSKVICYLTSTRTGMEVQMAMDIPRLLFDHLRALGPAKVPQIDLLLHSNGGDGVVPWRLVTLLREWCDKFAVLIPYRAFSAATLTALGADEIVMLPLAMLGPIDPTTANPFNPRDPANPQAVIGIGVEDVAAFVSLVKEDVGITHEDELVQAFNILAQNVHPLALGNVKRTSQQSRMMARKLLSLHMDRATDEHRIEQIVESLSSRLFYHGHPINRREAKDDLQLKVVDAPPTVETLVWELYLLYENEMLLSDPFNPAIDFVAHGPVPQMGVWAQYDPPDPLRLAIVESATLANVFVQQHRLFGMLLPQGIPQVGTSVLSQGWIDE